MFNGVMDPELIRLAQEQMSRMSPTELARMQQQMMANPELMRMASESMKNMGAEDLKHAAEQLKHTRPEDMAEIGEKMANASPEEIAAMRARFDAQVTYEINGAQMLKKQGNELHSQGRYSDALQKYLLAKKNLKGVPSSKGKMLMLACSLNLMSCYLKTKQYDECIAEGSEVLVYDAKNVKALYRRGQAYKELGRLEDAVSDLRKALEVSPDDETIAQVLRDAKERLAHEESHNEPRPRGLVIEEITKGVEDMTNEDPIGKSLEHSEAQQRINNGSNSESLPSTRGRTHSEVLGALGEDPEDIRSFQNFMSNAEPETVAALSGGKAGEISPDMFKAASNMITKMSPEELQRVLKMASQFQGENRFSNASSLDRSFNSSGTGSIPIPPNVTPEMVKTASDMMSKMSAEELQKMFEMTSSLRGNDSVPARAAVNLDGFSSNNRSKLTKYQKTSVSNGDNGNGEASSSSSFVTGSRHASQPNFPSSTAYLQEQMRNQMKDPATRQMFTSMMKNMSPEMISTMGEQFGLKLSQEDAARAQEAISSLSPEALDNMMLWSDRIQRGVDSARRAKNWLLGRQGLIFAICMLLLAIILHWLGFVGR